MKIDTRGTYSDNHQWNYNNFRLHQYHIKIEGLWSLGHKHFILCPDINRDTNATDGTNIYDWFKNYSLLGTPTMLVDKLPIGAKPVEDNNMVDKANFVSFSRNFTFFYDDLLLTLPNDFPEFRLADENTGITYFLTNRPLSSKEEVDLTEAIHKFKMAILLETRIVENFDGINQPIIEDLRLLRHSKSFTGLKNNKVKQVWEEDEDFWNDNKLNLLKPGGSKKIFYPQGFEIKSSSCLITDYLFPPNLRNFITLYNITYLNCQFWKILKSI